MSDKENSEPPFGDSAVELPITEEEQAMINAEEEETTTARFLEDRKRPKALVVVRDMNRRGRLIFGDDGEPYYFDTEEHRLMRLDPEDMDLRSLLFDRYLLNPRHDSFAYLIEHLALEARRSGEPATVQRFTFYDREANVLYLDKGANRMLLVTGETVIEADNGENGVLFLPLANYGAWDYIPAARPGLFENILIDPVNFGDDEEAPFTPGQQRLLLLLWSLSMAFESMMATKVIAVAVGPGGAGKSTMFRTIGLAIFGPRFRVQMLDASDKGRENFWVRTEHSVFTCWDNVDQPVKWLADALAVIATGAEKTERVLNTNAQMRTTEVTGMVAVTARTPSYSLQREDVAERSLIFHLAKRQDTPPEEDLLASVRSQRSELMSDYVHLLQRTLRLPLDQVRMANPGFRMADFGRVITRIGHGLGLAKETDAALWEVGRAQAAFATEENDLVHVLDLWLEGEKPAADGAMDVGSIPNDGRTVSPQELLDELKAVAKTHDIRLRVDNAKSLGRQLGNLTAAMAEQYEITRPRTKRAKGWAFRRRGDEGGRKCEVCSRTDHVRTFRDRALCPDHQGIVESNVATF